MKKRVQAGWRQVSGLICDKRVTTRVKGKINMMVVRSAVMHGVERVTLIKTGGEAEGGKVYISERVRLSCVEMKLESQG